jgi:hypothetical protein
MGAKGGILYPDGTDEKTRKSVQSVLESKHPNARTLRTDTLTAYLSLPDFVVLNIPKDYIEVTARCLFGGTELGRMVVVVLWQSKSNPATSYCQSGGLAGQFLPTMGGLSGLHGWMSGCTGQVPRSPPNRNW